MPSLRYPLHSRNAIGRWLQHGLASAGLHRWLLRHVLIYALVSGGALHAQDTLQIAKSFQTLDPVAAYFKGAAVPDSVQFSLDIGGMGDIDRDGIPDLAVGMRHDTIGYAKSGAVMILFMNANGTVKSHKRIASNTNGFNVTLAPGDNFGGRLANIGDLNGDGMTDMAVLASGDDDGGTDHGAVYILFLDTAATVIGHQKISDTSGGFLGNMSNGNGFSATVAEVGDMNGDDIQDIAVGAYLSDDNGAANSQRGALWILLMNTDGTVQGYRKYSGSSTWPGSNPLGSGQSMAHFGFSVAKLGDLDNDGYNDIAVSAKRQATQGRVYILFLNSTGGIKAYTMIGPGSPTNLGGLQLTLSGTGGQFGWSIDSMGDLNGDGTVDLALGLNMQNDGFTMAGVVLIGYLNPNGTLQYEEVISETQGTGGTSLGLHANAGFGFSVCAIGDLNGDHVMDLAVGTNQFNPGGKPRNGRVYLFELNAKPLLVTSMSTRDATLSEAGKVHIGVTGGVRPYRLAWMDPIPTPMQLDTWKATIDTIGFTSIGMPVVLPNTLTVDGFIALHDLDTAAMPVGAHPLLVVDAADTTRSLTVHIGEQLVQGTHTGASLANEKDLTKTGADGWSSMRFASLNRLAAGEDGWVRFIVPTIDRTIAVGLSVADTVQVSGYEQMDFGLRLSHDSIWCWDDGSLHFIDRKFKAGDQFRIERQADSVCYYLGQRPIRTVTSVPNDVAYMADCAAYQNGARIDQVTVSFAASFHVDAQLTHLPALTPNGGGIDLSITPNSGTYTFDWSDGPATSQDRDSLPPGHYEVDIASSHYGHTRRSTFSVGNELYWSVIPAALTDTLVGSGTELSRITGKDTWQAAISENLAWTSVDHWSVFRPAQSEEGSLMAWRSTSDSVVWAAWWVYPFGQELLANAVSETGVVATAIVDNTDRLWLTGAGEDSILFMLNEDTLHVIQNTTHEAPFRLLIGLRSENDRVVGASTSLALPLKLNTNALVPGIPYTFETPGGINTTGISGSTLSCDPGYGAASGDHELYVPATDSTDAITLLFKLGHGGVSDMRLLLNDTTYTIDSTLYEVYPPNELVLYDGPPSPQIEIPEAYQLDLEDDLLMTPNGDGLNDEFKLADLDIATSYELTITDRDTNILFHSEDPEEGWNGRYMNEGSYAIDGVYVFTLLLNGDTYEGQFLLSRNP